MEQYKQEFIDFMVESDVLKFGDFTLKSGRKSPFFMNAGAYVTGSQLKRLGEYYAKAIHANYGDNLLFIRLSRLYYCLKLLYYTLFTHFTPLPSSSSRQTRYHLLRDNTNPLSAVRSHVREASARS